MKKILYLFIALFAFSCADREADIYKDENLLNFNKGTTKNVFVLSSQQAAYTDQTISYGVIKPVQGTHQVKLVVDAANTNAVLGVDYDLIKSTDELTDGESSGEFVVRVYKAPTTQAGKHISFKLESTTLKNAVFDQVLTFNIFLTCPISSFVGDFVNDEAWWDDPGNIFTVQESTVANQLLVKDFFEPGVDLVLNYDPNTYVVTVPDQSTGYFHPTYNAYIRAKASTDPTQVSSFNPCSRKMTLYINYYIPNVGGWGNQKEGFTGL